MHFSRDDVATAELGGGRMTSFSVRGRKEDKKCTCHMCICKFGIVLYRVLQCNRPAIYGLYVLYHTRGTFKGGACCLTHSKRGLQLSTLVFSLNLDQKYEQKPDHTNFYKKSRQHTHQQPPSPPPPPTTTITKSDSRGVSTKPRGDRPERSVK